MLRNERILQAKAKYARKEVQLLMQVWVVNVIICFGVIAMCSKYKLVLSISIISGQIIHWFITSLKECKRCCYALNLRGIQWMTASGADLQNSKKIKSNKFVLKSNSKSNHIRPIF